MTNTPQSPASVPPRPDPSPATAPRSRTDRIRPARDGVALVAGASRGLGLLIARELAARGFRVVGCARDQNELDRAQADLQARGATATMVCCDVSDPQAVQAMITQVEEDHGPIEVAVHVAGIIQVGPWSALTRGHFDQAVDVMLWGPINLALAVVPRMTARGSGRFAVVSSVGGGVSVPHLLPYSTAKFAAVGFTEGLRAELSGTGVTATTVMPGLMRTGSHLNAQFVGDATADYSWFAAAASAPLLSMNAERAARRIVSGVLAGAPHVVLTPVAKVGLRVHGVAPSTTVRLLGLISRILPKDTRADESALSRGRANGSAALATSAHSVPGHQARAKLASSLVNRLTTLGDRAAQRYYERPRRP